MIYKDICLFRLVDNDVAKAFDLPRSQIALRANELLCKYGRYHLMNLTEMCYLYRIMTFIHISIVTMRS